MTCFTCILSEFLITKKWLHRCISLYCNHFTMCLWMDIYVVCRFFAIINSFAVNINVQDLLWIYIFPLIKIPRCGISGSLVNIHTFWNVARLFSIATLPFYIPIINAQRLVYPYSHQHCYFILDSPMCNFDLYFHND